MSITKTNTNIHNSYIKFNQIRTKLLLFIDNDIQSKIKHQNLKFKCEDEIKISFEESFIQKQADKYDFPSSLKTKKNDDSDKSLSTIDVSSNKIPEKSNQKERVNIHAKTFAKVCNRPNKLSNNIVCFNRKVYSIKNLSKQSSTFLILPKQKNAFEYLKNLCNNLKICKKHNKPPKNIRSISISPKFFDFIKDKKTLKKRRGIKMQKLTNDNLYSISLLKKSQKENFETNSKHRIYRKSTNSILIAK